MPCHIILAAFGTTSSAQKIYAQLQEKIAASFPEAEVHVIFSSRQVRRTMAAPLSQKHSLSHLLGRLSNDTDNKIIVQSLHVVPGTEFHSIVRQTLKLSANALIGHPLLGNQDDYRRVSACLETLIGSYECDAALVLGHGTSHPCWTAYPALEQELRRRLKTDSFVAAIERSPDNSELVIEQLRSGGYKKILVVPFLMVAGMHFQRDIISEQQGSWKTRLASDNIRLILHDQGLALLPGITEIFCDHIRSAQQF